MALRRIQREFREMETEGRYPVTIPDNDMFNWHTTIIGPADSPYEGGVFKLEITFPYDYPFSKPTVRFLTKIYHPSISKTGHYCIDMLWDNWKPNLKIPNVLDDTIALLAYELDERFVYPDIYAEFCNDKKKFLEIAREWTRMYAT